MRRGCRRCRIGNSVPPPDALPQGRGALLMIAGLLLLTAAYVLQHPLLLAAGTALLMLVWWLNRSAWPQVFSDTGAGRGVFARRGAAKLDVREGRP